MIVSALKYLYIGSPLHIQQLFDFNLCRSFVNQSVLLPHLFINDEMPIEYTEVLHVLLYVFHMNLKVLRYINN